LRYVDASQTGGGDVSNPQIIGQGGWQQFRFLFPGADNVIYAVDQAGRLLRYVDASQTGGGDVSNPQIIGQGGWQQFRFLFPGTSNVIYAVVP
ncbi:tachylectin-related carbohydrate-binding protein, partial [Micromonospora sp. S4605]|uniref:tachylectin-related carbohydrate-binding protein n=1 Tax=Micromonospora sp. S4605 TaxID=1420897 RepID=UPI0013052106